MPWPRWTPHTRPTNCGWPFPRDIPRLPRTALAPSDSLPPRSDAATASGAFRPGAGIFRQACIPFQRRTGRSTVPDRRSRLNGRADTSCTPGKSTRSLHGEGIRRAWSQGPTNKARQRCSIFSSAQNKPAHTPVATRSPEKWKTTRSPAPAALPPTIVLLPIRFPQDLAGKPRALVRYAKISPHPPKHSKDANRRAPCDPRSPGGSFCPNGPYPTSLPEKGRAA
ncbi:hypothetical protein D1872_208470 [compost metagenome]